MGQITVVGLGPGDPRFLTREAWEVLAGAGELWLRTRTHPTVEGLPESLVIHSFDGLYEELETFDAVYRAIVDRLMALVQRPAGVVYGVPGHPLVGEATVKRLLERVDAETSVRIVEGLSFVEPTLTALQIDALDGLQVFDAADLAARHHPPINPDYPALLGQLYSRLIASEVKLVLMNQYPDDHLVTLIEGAGTEQLRVDRMPLFELDRRDDLAHLTSLYVPPLPGTSSFEAFQETIARLRAPGGCPWDREQTHESLRVNLLEEAYEVVAAIDAGDVEDIQEELGDLLLQVVIQTQVAAEADEFKMPDVIAGIDAKLKYRHPHVWGEREVSGSEEVIRRWEELKDQEKDGRESILGSVPRALPALQQADTYGRRAARVGFDWSGAEGVVDKVREEIAELVAAATPEERESELGDLLFAVVNWARWLDIDPEAALRQTNTRFKCRFGAMERLADAQGLRLSDLTIDELEQLWQTVKQEE